MDLVANNLSIPLRERINLRIVFFAVLVLFLIGTPVYIFLRESITGGIENVGDLKTVDLKAMGNFPFDEIKGTVNDIPQRYRALDGQRIQLEGQVFAPNDAGDHMTRFELVYSIAKCCFQGPPQVQERVFVEVPRNIQVANLSERYARVTGRLRIDLNRQLGKATQVYVLQMDGIEGM